MNLLDDLDKELNNYIMRCREWYGWHFPELSKIITDNLAFVRTVEVMGTRDNAKHVDLSEHPPRGGGGEGQGGCGGYGQLVQLDEAFGPNREYFRPKGHVVTPISA